MPAPEARMGLQWVDGASAILQRQGEEVTISYCWPDGDGWRTAVQTVRLMAYRPHFGGVRFYLACPPCERRVAKLYDVAGGWFTCRICGRVANRSQSQGAFERSLLRARKIRQRLGAAGSVGDALPPKPKWMRWQTYEALVAEVQALEALPPTAWLTDGHHIALGVRRSTMGAKGRCRWWPGRNYRAKPSARAGIG
jgi:hypothetical protein